MVAWVITSAFNKAPYSGLGFKVTYAFNKALLPKQWWHLLSRPHSLIATLLKAKYFPNCSIHERRITHNASFFWRSIYNARWIIDQGGIWKVDRSHIKFWEHRWIPSNSDFLAQSPPPRDVSVILVSDLIEAETCR